MILELSPGAVVTVDGLRYTVDEHSAFHEADFRMDLTHLSGPTPAHDRWVLTIASEGHPALLTPLQVDWLETPKLSLVHDGEIYALLSRGSAHRVWHARGGRGKEARADYAVFRADSGKVVLVLTGIEGETNVWSGSTVSASAISGLKR
jgi:hypothetical protein